jgi:FixJ family two-component response regulator
MLNSGMTGRGCFAAHRVLAKPLVRQPAALLSGFGGKTVHTLESGASQFIEKPFAGAEIVAVLDRPVPEICDE